MGHGPALSNNSPMACSIQSSRSRPAREFGALQLARGVARCIGSAIMSCLHIMPAVYLPISLK